MEAEAEAQLPPVGLAMVEVIHLNQVEEVEVLEGLDLEFETPLLKKILKPYLSSQLNLCTRLLLNQLHT